MFYIITYDTPSDRRRRRMAKAIRDYGDRVQKSVFEAYLQAPSLRELEARLAKMVDLAEDDLRIYPVPLDTLKLVRVLGKGKITEPQRAVAVV